tara:strand:- start:224 stop:493 length:270 start_codon:yes stop_codon:yes gene_type:complete
MNIRQIFKVSLIFILFASTNTVYAKENKYPRKVCEGIYGSIGLFVKIADSIWKKKNNDKKAVLYSQAAANYATIYETVCREGKSHKKKN